jgi:hypothetical protein
LIIMKRTNKSLCPTCNRVHDSEHPYLVVCEDGTVLFDCRRSEDAKRSTVGMIGSAVIPAPVPDPEPLSEHETDLEEPDAPDIVLAPITTVIPVISAAVPPLYPVKPAPPSSFVDDLGGAVKRGRGRGGKTKKEHQRIGAREVRLAMSDQNMARVGADPSRFCSRPGPTP